MYYEIKSDFFTFHWELQEQFNYPSSLKFIVCISLPLRQYYIAYNTHIPYLQHICIREVIYLLTYLNKLHINCSSLGLGKGVLISISSSIN
jgi:hypothetical protein